MMLFHTWEFVIFFSIVMAVYIALKKTKWWQLWLLLVSYFFYGWWNPLFLILIIYSTFVDYLAGLKLGDSKWKKSWLAFSLVNNLFMLGFFKYAGFFADNLRTLFVLLHIPLDVPHPNILLPVGISFFTFQSMSYTIDVYLKQVKIEKNFIRFAAFVSLFPQLVAGPIERAKALLPQMRHEPLIRKVDVSDGISLFLVGLFKKAVMADFLSIYAEKIYSDPSIYGSWALLFGTYAFAWQIYFDFSGYTDMARGIGRMMGIRLMLNFNNPYTAVDLGDFWRRWHISLSSWFKDYVYIPLGGNRGIKYRVYWNLILTMVISGFWHGAAWTFIIWGGLNALGRVATMEVEKSWWYKKIPVLVKQLLVFHFICLTWVFFRAASVADALLILKRFFSGTGGDAEIPVILFSLVGMVWLYQLTFNSKLKPALEYRIVRIGCLVGAMLLYLIFSSTANKQFIYFQF
ncbi:MAG: MBOAT family O-acyltransferase [Victivallaceae bacterium]